MVRPLVRLLAVALCISAASAEQVPVASATVIAPGAVTSGPASSDTRALEATAPEATAARTPGARSVAPWSLVEVKRRARLANRPFRDARTRVLAARLQVQVAWSEVFAPQLTATYNATNGSDDSGSGRVGVRSTALGFDIEPYVRSDYRREGRLGDDGSPTSEAAYTSAAGISISRQLFRIAEHLRKRLPVTQAERDLYVAANDLVLKARELELTATDAFLDVQQGEARRILRERRLDDAKSFAIEVRDKLANGFAAPLDGLNAELDVNQAEADLLAEDVALAASRRRFNDLLDRPLADPVVLQVEDLASAGATVASHDLVSDLARVLDAHETLGTKVRDLELAHDRRAIARDDLFPQVQATATAERRAFGTAIGGNTDGFDTVAGLRFDLTLPLDGWRAERARLRQADLDLDQLQRGIITARNELESRLTAAHQRLAQVRTSIPLAESRLEIERRRLAAQLRLFQAGSVTNLEVVRAKRAVDEAELSLLQLRASLITTDTEYRSLLPVTPALPDVPDEHP